MGKKKKTAAAEESPPAAPPVAGGILKEIKSLRAVLVTANVTQSVAARHLENMALGMERQAKATATAIESLSRESAATSRTVLEILSHSRDAIVETLAAKLAKQITDSAELRQAVVDGAIKRASEHFMAGVVGDVKLRAIRDVNETLRSVDFVAMANSVVREVVAATVRSRNLAGHRFEDGVRMKVELTAAEADDERERLLARESNGEGG